MEACENPSSGSRTLRSGEPVILVGGSGFIGTRLAGLLEDAGIPFRVGDLRKSEAFPDRWQECDVRRPETMRELFRGARAVINLAAEHRDDVRPLSRYHETNVEGARQLCAAAQATGIQQIIFTSSVAVYGFQPKPVGEDGPFAPFNEYGRTKLQAEDVYRDWAAEDAGRSLVIVRPTVVFGEGNRANVYNLLRQVASGRFLMTGSGKNVKSMSYVGNVAAFLMYALRFGPGLHIFNYADGPDMTTMQLVCFIQECLGRPGRVPRIPMPLAMAGGHLMDLAARVTGRTFPISAIRIRKFCENTQVRADLLASSGFIPPCSLREALSRTIRFEFSSRT